MPGVMGGLHAKPRCSPIAKQFAKPHRDRRRNGLCFPQHIIKMLARNAEQGRNFNFGPTRGRNDNLAQQGAGMAGAA